MRYAKSLRSNVRWFRRAYVQVRSSALADFPLTARRTLVVAPHPDDEVFGTGALIASKKAAGATVSVLFLTNGEASHNGCCGIDKGRVSAERRELARQAACQLGTDPGEYIFLNFPDGMLPRYGTRLFQEVAASVRKVFEVIGPEEIFCTHPAEVWNDHVATSEIVQHVWSQNPYGAAKLWHYFVWAPLNQSVAGLWDLPWLRARKLSIEPWRASKQLAANVYLNAKAAPECQYPWIGNLPRDFLEISESPYEIYFEADVGPRTALVNSSPQQILPYGLSMEY